MVIALVSESLLYLVVGWAWAGVGCTLSPAIYHGLLLEKIFQCWRNCDHRFRSVIDHLMVSTPLEEMMTSRFTTFFIALFFGIVFSLLMPDKEAAVEEDLKEDVAT